MVAVAFIDGQTDMQLNTWVDNSSPDFSAHYGQSFLYLAYFLDRFGDCLNEIGHAAPRIGITWENISEA